MKDETDVRAPRFGHVHLHQGTVHIHEKHLQTTLLPRLSMYAYKSRAC